MTFGRFVPVRSVGDRLVAFDDAGPDFADALRQVLDFYDVPWREQGGDVLVTTQLLADLDTCWNYTTKATDAAWLETHPAA